MAMRHNPRMSSLTAVHISDEPLPLPAEHLASPTISESQSPNKSRPTSLYDDLPGRLKSATFTQPAPRPNNVSRHRHTASAVPVSRTSPDLTETEDPTTRTTEYMTALAAQERRVLELKEELRQAEANLSDLKKQWAQQESSNRRNESKRLHQMRPLHGSVSKLPRTDDNDGSSAWMYEEMERRKALMGNGHGHARNASRRVFSGSRHAKTLSLIPPTKEESEPALSPSPEMEDRNTRPTRFERARTTPDLTRLDEHVEPRPSSPQREVLQAGKQMASDWKDGLWTFFEDLKQATVGDDIRNAQGVWPGPPRKNSTTDGPKRNKGPFKLRPGVNQSGPIKPSDDAPLIDAASEFWKEHGLDAPKDLENPAVKRHVKQQTPQKAQILEDDSWDSWDTPSPSHTKKSSSGDNSTSSTSPGASSPATSLEATPRASMGSAPSETKQSRRESLAWPALTKLGPAQLRRTASHLLSEWERSLTPPAEDESKKRRPSDNAVDRTAEQEMLSHLR